MRLSIVIPAYNEEKYLPATPDAINATKTSETEVIVVDNISTDLTRRIAEERGALVVTETERNIAKVRNTGAASASGNVLVFIDADTIVRPGTFEKIERTLGRDESCFGGSCAVEYEPIKNRLVIAWFMLLWPFLGKLTRMRGGHCSSPELIFLASWVVTTRRSTLAKTSTSTGVSTNLRPLAVGIRRLLRSRG
jgi:glycosyltransferase involved in cell wall biosynthesis